VSSPSARFGPSYFQGINANVQYPGEPLSGASGWVLTDACGINDAGQIVGTGTYQAKKTAFILTPK
jgi:hypothetical protein